ncbi:unnamed protein product [Laminaria digitata]
MAQGRFWRFSASFRTLQPIFLVVSLFLFSAILCFLALPGLFYKFSFVFFFPLLFSPLLSVSFLSPIIRVTSSFACFFIEAPLSHCAPCHLRPLPFLSCLPLCVSAFSLLLFAPLLLFFLCCFAVMTGYVQKDSDRAWYKFDSFGLSQEFIRNADANYKRKASGCVKDDTRIEITKKAIWGVSLNILRRDFFPLYMSPVQVLLFAINSGEYSVHFSWVSPSGAHGIPVEKDKSIWTCYVSPLQVTREDVYNVFFDTHPASSCLAWELSDRPFADMTADGARSHASRRRDVLTAMAAAGDNLDVGAAGSLPATPAPTTTASPPSPGSPAGDTHTPAAGSSTSSPVASMAAFLSGSDTLLLPIVAIGQDSSDDEGG